MRKGFGFLGAVLVALPLGWMLGCNGSDKPAGIRVTLVDGPLSGYQEINLDIQSVEIRGNGNWITLATPKKVVNLLSLVGGVSEVLADTTLAEGRYGQMRLVLGSANTLKLADGTVVPLTVPSGLQTGVKLIVNFEVAAGTTKDVWIDFDAAHSIHVVGAGASGQYLLRPTVWAYDKIATGSISGRLTTEAGAALADVVVTAQVLDGAGKPTVVRTVPTGADGTYTLNLLPVGYTYHVVSQPITGTVSYQAKASAGFALSAASPTFTYDASFASAASTATVNVTFATPVTADQHDVVDLLQTLPEGMFVLRTAVPALNSGVESCSFDLVPQGEYSARKTRVTTASDGSTTSATTYVPTFILGSGGATVAF